MRSENVESSCSSVLLSRPVCGDTSRSARILSARRTIGNACAIGAMRRPARAAALTAGFRTQVLVGDELVAVALQDHARERAAADDEHLLVVLLELLDEREEVAVAADDHVGVDVRVRERHLEGVEREVDVGAVLVAARRQVALHEADGVLRERPAVLAGARPVGVGDLGDDLAALLDGVEDDADVEMLAEGGLDADFDVVEVDEDGDVETFLMGKTNNPYMRVRISERAVERQRLEFTGMRRSASSRA